MFTVVTTAAMAQGGFFPHSDRYNPEQPGPTQNNPWTLPQPLVSPPGSRPAEYQSLQNKYGQHGSVGSAGSRQQPGPARAERFVTPEFLESLKQQQEQYQVMPKSQHYQHNSPRHMPDRPLQGFSGRGLSGQGGPGSSLYGMGFSNPLYDAPAVSPWGDGADVLYRGESYPLVPREAIGGIAPMPMRSYGTDNSGYNGSAGPSLTDENNVFNPFTFLPNNGLRRP